MHALKTAIDLLTLQYLAKELGVSYQAIQGWIRRGHMPRTEWTGETEYAKTISKLTDGIVSVEELLKK
jgi:hypothetical protein